MMAKLYWSVKRNGKWTWRPANVKFEKTNDVTNNLWIEIVTEEEE
jgi:hypothetical protein